VKWLCEAPGPPAQALLLERERALGGVRRKACLARGTPQGVRKETGVWFADSTCTAVLRQLRLEAFCVFAASTGTLTFFEIVKIG
jgi:hypothetical protein